MRLKTRKTSTPTTSTFQFVESRTSKGSEKNITKLRTYAIGNFILLSQENGQKYILFPENNEQFITEVNKRIQK